MRRYISSAGADSNPGTLERPWATLTRLTQAITSKEIGRGDSVLLRRGDSFYGSLTTVPVGGLEGMLTIGAYGTGPRPKVIGYKVSTDSWTLHTAGIWKLNMAAESGHFTGNVSEPATDVGFLKIGDTIHGRKRDWMAHLTEDWTFLAETDGWLYVKSPVNPGAGVHMAPAVSGATLSNYVRLQDIHLSGFGSHGVHVVSSKHVRVRRNLIEDIGGAGRYDNGRRGNGVEVWIGAEDVLVEYNTIRQTYDVACTMQGTWVSYNIGWRDVHFRHNVIENCNMSFEMWAAGSTDPTAGFVNCGFTDNECRDAGESWGMAVRGDVPGRGTHLLTYQMTLPLMDVEIARNTFYNAEHNYAYFSADVPAGLNFHDNHIYLKEGSKIVHQDAETVEDSADYVARTGREQGSRFYILPTDPPTTKSAALTLLAAQTSHALSIPVGLPEDEPEGGRESYRSNVSSVPTNYSKLATLTARGEYAASQALVAFQNGGDSEYFTSYGLLDVRVSGGGGGAARHSVAVLGSLGFSATSSIFTMSDFAAVLTVNDTVNSVYTVELYVKMSDTYSWIEATPLITQGEVQFLRVPVTVPSLPAGAVKTPVAPEYVQLPYVGTVAPATIPAYVGQEYVDSVAKKVYKAVGTASSADWVALN